MTFEADPASFRDPDGFIFSYGSAVYRAIAPAYQQTWRALNEAKFFKALIEEKKLLGYANAAPDEVIALADPALVIRPEFVPFISYPCEWTFSQLRSAALLTLDIQERAMAEGYSLKDASAFNVQFTGTRAVFIDHLSFEAYDETSPWKAYGQFCRHFLGPLLVEKHRGAPVRAQLSRTPDGIALHECAALLPASTRLSITGGIHIHLHARMERQKGSAEPARLKTSPAKTRAIITQLKDAIRSMKARERHSVWDSYYDTFSYTEAAFAEKKRFVEKHLANGYRLCIDLGANTGEFSRIAAKTCATVIAADSDFGALDRMAGEKHENIVPLFVDLANPTPSFGWASSERVGFTSRLSKADIVLALAFVHHLCLSNNVPLSHFARYLSQCSGELIVEFVPMSDPQSQRLIAGREHMFGSYTEQAFTEAFKTYYTIEDELRIKGMDRVLFKMRRK